MDKGFKVNEDKELEGALHLLFLIKRFPGVRLLDTIPSTVQPRDLEKGPFHDR
jgi:hypothetical protein